MINSASAVPLSTSSSPIIKRSIHRMRQCKNRYDNDDEYPGLTPPGNMSGLNDDASCNNPVITTSSSPVKKRIIEKGNSKNIVSSNYDEQLARDSASSLLMLMGREDEEGLLHRMDQRGELDQVAGSQSMLSQELIMTTTNSFSQQEDMNDISLLSQSSANACDLIIDAAQHLAQREYQKETSCSVSSPPLRKRLPFLQEDQKEQKKNYYALKLLSNSPSSKPVLSHHQDYFCHSQSSSSIRKVSANSSVSSSSSSTPSNKSTALGNLRKDVDTKDSIINNTESEDLKFKKNGPWKKRKLVSRVVKQEEIEGGNINEEDLLTIHSKVKCNHARLPVTSPVKSIKSIVNDLEEAKRNNKDTKKRNYDNTGRLNIRLLKEKKREEELECAKEAALLAKQILKSPTVTKQLLLAMALKRENPRQGPETYPVKGSVLNEGFYWANYPPLESALREYMEEYYDLSMNKCQSKDQQAFNNKLVKVIRNMAHRHGWTIDLEDRALRDRIRCFFKTHIQNAKKRMKTMVRNPTKKANAKALAAHMDLIQRTQRSDCIQEKETKNIIDPKEVNINDDNNEHYHLELDDDDGHIYQNSQELVARLTGDSDYNNDKIIQDVESNDAETHDVAQQVLALGFPRLSQDSQL